jgi:hypothetical protein
MSSTFEFCYMSKLLNTSEIINTINSQIHIKPQALDKTFVINVITLKIRKKRSPSLDQCQIKIRIRLELDYVRVRLNMCRQFIVLIISDLFYNLLI